MRSENKLSISMQPSRDLSAASLISFLLQVEMGHSVPKIIHQTYPTRELPGILRKNVDNLKASNPGWDYRFYTDDDIREFIKSNYGDGVLTYFDRINPAYGAARADLFRYLLLYVTGGVYLDIKSTARRPLDDVIDPEDRYILSTWRNQPGEVHEGSGLWPELSNFQNGEFQQWHIIASAGHPFLRTVISEVLTNIEQYDPRTFGTGKLAVLRVTGPIAYTRAIFPQRFLPGTRIIPNETALDLEYSVFNATEHCEVFTSHYKTRYDPLIRQPGLRGARSAITYSLKSAKRATLRAFKVGSPAN